MKYNRGWSKCIVLASILLQLWWSPYTKVEESFNMQAGHDLLTHKWWTREGLLRFDHFSFPGVVPRTFIGALAASAIATPWLAVSSFFARLCAQHNILVDISYFILSQEYMLYVFRASVGVLCWLSYCIYRKAVASKFGYRSAKFTDLLISTAFHVPFYASRTLPNTFALILVLRAFAYWFNVCTL